MKKLILIAASLCIGIIFFVQAAGNNSSFRENQKKNSRVKTAYLEKEEELKKLLRKNSIDINEMKIFIRVFKKEATMEMWAAGKNSQSFSFVRSYPICASSGKPGPKRRGGDGQVPEGFYHIESFNPFSNFYLSLKVSYPNQSDGVFGDQKNLGGDIFIHGNCVTIGCMPITDDKIKEVYLLAVEAKNAGQSNIPVHIFPCKMDGEGMKQLEKEFSQQQKLLNFWKNLKQGFDFFEKEKKIPVVTVNKEGSYFFKAE